MENSEKNFVVYSDDEGHFIMEPLDEDESAWVHVEPCTNFDNLPF